MPSLPPARVPAVAQAARTGGGGGGGGGDEAAHNWDHVLCQYNNGSAGREIEDAFTRAGYYDSAHRRRAILQALRDKGWARSKIAHSLGGQQSGKRGGTDTKIQNCKSALLTWASEHPASSGAAAAAGSGRGRTRRGKVGEEEYDRESFRAHQFARWAREGDADALRALRAMAERGNKIARGELAELEPPPRPAMVPASASSPPHSLASSATTTSPPSSLATHPPPPPTLAVHPMPPPTPSSLAVHPPPPTLLAPPPPAVHPAPVGVPPLTRGQLAVLYPGQTAGGHPFSIWGV